MELVDHENARLAKALVDSQRVEDFPTALKALAKMRFHIAVSNKAVTTPAGQSAALTAVATGVRTGGVVSFSPIPNTKLRVSLVPGLKQFREAMLALGAEEGLPQDGSDVICVGDDQARRHGVRTWIDGWWGGALDVHDGLMDGDLRNPLTGIFAGALAVLHAFRRRSFGVQRIVPAGLNLWDVHARTGAGGTFDYLPATVHLIGLGHLGQAVGWSLCALPYRNAHDFEVTLQDFDVVTKANWGTSLLVPHGKYGQRKTRAAQQWLEARGFRTVLVEKRITQHSRRDPQESPVAVCGLDNLEARRHAAGMGFPLVLDMGLGRSHADYLSFAVNSFGREANASSYWCDVTESSEAYVRRLLQLKGYQRLAEDHAKDQCGTIQLAGRSVATAFVGAAVGALTVTQLLRATSGAPLPSQIRASLQELEIFEADARQVAPVPVQYTSSSVSTD